MTYRIMGQHRFGNAIGKSEICRCESKEIAEKIAAKLRKETFQSGTRRLRRYGSTIEIEEIKAAE